MIHLFTPRVASNVHTVPESGCWLWAGKWDNYGYGYTNGNRGAIGAHRLFYTALVGEIPAGMQLCHKCDTPSCVNPDHLFVGDSGANAIDRELKNRGRWREVHAPKRKARAKYKPRRHQETE